MVLVQDFRNWEVGYSDSKRNLPSEWVEAVVPGAVQLDWARAKKYDDYRIADNYKKFEWMEDKYWFYKTVIEFDEIVHGKRYFFISKGIDYEFEILVNGALLHYQEGMYKHVEIDITKFLRKNTEIVFKVFPAPKIHPQPVNHVQVSQSCKPPASYGWDWHPRLIPLGIWDETYLEIRETSYISKMVCEYSISKTLDLATAQFNIDCKNGAGKEYKLEIESNSGIVSIMDGEIEEDSFSVEFEILNPELWYPRGYGEQSLYKCRFSLYDEGRVLDSKTKRIGFRQTRLVMNEGAWDEPEEFPKTRSIPPMQLEINGMKIFCKGSNWVMPEIFYGTLTPGRYRELLDLVIEANFNMIRLWGGAIINKEFFYDYCDENGILVWQEFPLACNNYFDSTKYLNTLESEAKAIIERIKQHPSLAFWCGGNELFNNWSGMTDQSKALRLLNKLCYEYDQNTPFIPTSPVMGMAHGHYLFHDFDNGKNIFEIYPGKKFSAMTEYGVSGASDAETIREIIPEEELWPPKKESCWKDHHAFGVWTEDSWLCLNAIEKYFGTPNNLEDLVEGSQTLQAVGLQFIFEESRRMQPYCSMTLNWCFNDCWPSAANTSIVEYPNLPKKAFYSVQAACRPVLASARASKFSWKPGEEFNLELFILNDSINSVPEGKIDVFVKSGDLKSKMLEWNYPAGNPQENIEGDKLSFIVPEIKSDSFSLILEDEENSSINSEYFFLIEQ